VIKAVKHDFIAAVLPRTQPCHETFAMIERLAHMEVGHDQNAESAYSDRFAERDLPAGRFK